MASLDRRRRRRVLAGARGLVVLGVVSVLVVGAGLVGGILRAGSESVSFDRAVNRSYAVEARLFVEQSNLADRQFRSLLASMSTDGRLPLQAALDTLVRTTASIASAAATAASPAPSSGVATRVTTAMADRAEAMRRFRSAVDRLLGMAPLPVTGAPRAASAPSAVRALSPSAAAGALSAVGALLAEGDRVYAAGRRALHAAPGAAQLPPSSWATSTAAWTEGVTGRLVDALVGSPTLAAQRRIVLVRPALVLTPAPVPHPGAGTAAGASVLPPTGRLSITAVVADNGNVAERGIVVKVRALAAATTSRGPASGGTVRTSRPFSLAPTQSTSVSLPPIRVVPGRRYTVVVSVLPPAPSVPGTVATDSVAVAVAPPGPPTVGQVLPAKGRARGGTGVTILGSGFTWVSTVTFGPARARFKVVSSTQITAVAPPGSGTVDVRVANPGGPSATLPADRFSYRRG